MLVWGECLSDKPAEWGKCGQVHYLPVGPTSYDLEILKWFFLNEYLKILIL